MGDITQLKTKQVVNKEELDLLIAKLTSLHAEGKLKSVAAFYIDSDGENYTWITNSMNFMELSYGITLLNHSLNRYIGDTR